MTKIMLDPLQYWKQSAAISFLVLAHVVEIAMKLDKGLYIFLCIAVSLAEWVGGSLYQHRVSAHVLFESLNNAFQWKARKAKTPVLFVSICG